MYNSIPKGIIFQVQWKICSSFENMWASLTMVDLGWSNNSAKECNAKWLAHISPLKLILILKNSDKSTIYYIL